MMLTFTHYVDTAPQAIERGLGSAISTGLDAASGLVVDARNETATAAIDGGLRVSGGLDALTGTEIRVSGSDTLSTVQVSVPWSQPDEGSSKLWAAVRFASVVADEVRVAA